MQIKCNLNDLEKTGVYIFRNTLNNKCYIGSTIVSFQERMKHHVNCLRINRHKNSHFQHAWNKYGESVFEYDVLEICEKDKCLLREQYYLDTILFAKEYIDGISTKFLELGYNINPLATGTPSLSVEAQAKRLETYKKFIHEASKYYQDYKNNKINLEYIPEKYLACISNWSSHIPWNKNKKYKSTDHLKVKKTKTEALINAIKFKSEQARNKSESIYVYDLSYNFIGKWRSPVDLYEWSLSELNNLNIVFKGKIKDKILLPQNIAKACKTNKPYKGFYFTKTCRSSKELEELPMDKNGRLCDENIVLTN